MGAIILSNYVARSGKHCSLDAAISVSGGLDMRHQLNFRRSMRLWQPMLTFGLRDDILTGKRILYSLFAYVCIFVPTAFANKLYLNFSRKICTFL